MNKASKIAKRLQSIALRVARKSLIAERVTISIEWLNAIRKEYLTHIRRWENMIQDKYSMIEARDEMNDYRARMEHMFYDVVLNKHMKELSSGKYQDGDEPVSEKELRSVIWNFVIAISIDYDVERDVDMIEEARQEGRESYERQATDSLKRHKKTMFSLMRRTGQKLIKEMKWYINVMMKQEDKSVDDANKVTVGPFTLLPIGGLLEEDMERAVAVIKRGIAIVSRAGFKKCLNPMKVYIDGKSHSLNAAEYSINNDVINVHTLGMSRDAHTIAHELGHRYYYRVLDQGRRVFWQDAFNGDLVEITSGDVDSFLTVMHRNEGEVEKSKGLPPSFEDIVKGSVDDWARMHSEDPLVNYKVDYFIEKGGFVWGPKKTLTSDNMNETEAWRRFEKFFKKNLEGKKVMRNRVTDYGNTNPQEAFAEIFMLVCMRKKVNPIVLSWFRKITE